MRWTTLKPGRLMALALTAQIAMGLPLVASAAFFRDTQSYWAAGAISTLSDQNILGGYPDGSFRPQGLITRAEFSAVLMKALHLHASFSDVPTFQDVPSGNWAYSAIEAAHSAGLVNGYPNGLFMPDRSISRAEALAILANAAHLPLPDDAQASQILSGFRDAAGVPAWARSAVAASVQGGIFANDPTRSDEIDALQPATRGEVAAMVEDLLVAQNRSNPASSAYNASTRTMLQGHVATVPANTTFTGTLTTPISSELNKVGDAVTLNVDTPLVSTDNRVIVPTGSKILGKISQVEPTRRTGGNAALDLTFNEIVTPDNQHYTISGSIATDDGMLHGGSTKGRVLKALGATAVGAGVGAVLGTAMGPLSGGYAGRGAIYGTAIGAGAGAIAAAAMKGKDVTVASGDKLQIKLNQPINVQVNQ